MMYMEDRRFPVVADSQRRHCDKRYYGDNRLAALDRDGYRCVSCGMTNEEHYQRWGKTLTIDHKDRNGRASATPNNDLDNLQTLCLRCHGAKDGPLNLAERVIRNGENHYGAKLTKALVAQMRRERRRGVTYLSLATAYNVSIDCAYRACIGKTWRSADSTELPVGEDHAGFAWSGVKHKNAKLNPDSVRSMRRDRRAGMSWKRLAAKYGVTPNAVVQVCTGRTWKSVPMEE